MKKLKFAILSTLLIINFSSAAQCSCTGSYIGDWDVSTLQQGVPTPVVQIRAGWIINLVGLIPGASYRISTCGAWYNSELTVFNSDCSVRGFSTNDPSGYCFYYNRGVVTTAAPADGIVRIKVNTWSCGTSDNSYVPIYVTLLSQPVCNPSISINTPTTSICSAETVAFNAIVTDAGINPTYNWIINGSAAGVNSSQFNANNLNQGDIISCEVTTNAGCSNISSATSNQIQIQQVNPAVTPTVAISSSQGDSICQGQQVVFSASITDGGSTPTYQWKKNGVNVGTGLATYTTSTLTNGDLISCELISNAQCASPNMVSSNQISMTVNPTVIPTVAISSSQGATICQGQQVIFTTSINNGGTAPTYQWKLNGVNVGANLPVYSNSSLANGDLISCQLTSNATCSSPTIVTSNTINMIVSSPVNPSFTQVEPVCEGENINPLLLTSTNNISGTWSPTFDNSTTTTYIFTPNPGQCANSTSMTVEVNPNPSVVITDNGGSLQATPGFSSYAWLLDGVIIPLAVTSEYIPTTNANYTVTVTDENGCSNSASYSVSNADVTNLTNGSFIIYPNPSSGIFNVDFKDAQNRNVLVFDNTGKLVFDSKSESQKFSLNLNHLSTGTYHLKVIENNQENYRIIVIN